MNRMTNQPVVYATFYPGGRIFPRYIKYRGITFKIKEVSHSWRERYGENTVFYFSLTDGFNRLIVSYSTPQNTWKVEEIYGEVE